MFSLTNLTKQYLRQTMNNEGKLQYSLSQYFDPDTAVMSDVLNL